MAKKKSMPSTEAKPITEAELKEARDDWGKRLVAISKAYHTRGIKAAVDLAEKLLDEIYGFNHDEKERKVLFKPTLAYGAKTFRTDYEGALSYFVGENCKYPDTGFALKGWVDVTSNAGECFIDGDLAMWMGSVTFTDRHGKETTVDKSWGYKRKGGALRIVLHHSSLPYTP